MLARPGPSPTNGFTTREEAVHGATGALGGILGWVTNTIGLGDPRLIVGAIVVAVLHVLPSAPRRGGSPLMGMPSAHGIALVTSR